MASGGLYPIRMLCYYSSIIVTVLRYGRMFMYRVLLVDDEESVLKVLKTSIDWLALGVDTPVTAADGVQALEAMERSPFHLLIADIKMPRMGGLELIRRVRQLYPETRCILLTAYSEFDYAKEAIRLGVENYLLKPVQKEELESTVQNAMANLYSHRGNGGNLLYENILHRWLAGAISGEELSERAGVLGLNLFLPQYCAVGILKRRQDSSTALFRSACLEQLGRQYEVYHCWNERGIFVLILGGRLLGRMELEHQLRALAGQLDAAGHALVAVGSAVTDPQALHLSACRRIPTPWTPIPSSRTCAASATARPAPRTAMPSRPSCTGACPIRTPPAACSTCCMRTCVSKAASSPAARMCRSSCPNTSCPG